MSTGFRYKYGFQWGEKVTDLEIEFTMLQQKAYKGSPLRHYLAIDRILWPEDDQHRWATLAFKYLAESPICVLMGCSDSGKTYPSAKWALIEYWTDPQNTLVIVSSTDVRGLELRVWGAIKELFNRALDVAPWLPGVALESKHAVTTDTLTEDDRKARVLRKGIICIPCLQGGRYVGLGKYVGVKQKRLRQVGDEVQLMGATFLDAIPNYMGKDYRGVFLGNPLEPSDCLGRLAEPLEGWDKHPEPEKTAVWPTRMHGGHCVNFVGTDSPNFDYPKDKPVKYKYMISWKKVEAVEGFWGLDSIQYMSQCKGVMRNGLVGHRIITKGLCEQHGAYNDVVWKDTEQTSLYACDPAYGGEDRCVGGRISFGLDPQDNPVIKVYMPRVIPVIPGIREKPESQIARAIEADLVKYDIPPERCFYDSFGKGTMGQAFAEVFGNKAPVAVDSGGRPSKRPVRNDLFVKDESTGQMRLKRCDEHYSKFVTELWFSVRLVIECGQMKELPYEVSEEGCLREYGMVQGNKIEVEKKADTRKRMGRSPDFFDWLAIAVEGARQLGFTISAFKTEFIENDVENPIIQAQEDFDKALRDAQLSPV